MGTGLAQMPRGDAEPAMIGRLRLAVPVSSALSASFDVTALGSRQPLCATSYARVSCHHYELLS